VTGEGGRGAKLSAFRAELGIEKTASFFRTPDELATLVLAALNMAITQRKPEGVIRHSDQGSRRFC
jgi:transposase InsO family protein